MSKTDEKTLARTNGSTPAEVFDRAALKRVCETDAWDLAYYYGMSDTTDLNAPVGAQTYWLKDNGARVLAVAHLDTVCQDRTTTVADTAAGPIVMSGALDDRLGAYVIAEMLPRLGLTYDLLFTEGEEQGMSTAQYFDPANHHDRTYDWVIEFDRGGTDVVLYQYEDDDLINLVEDTRARVSQGVFSDISYMGHLGVKAMNWGVGYRDYHGPRGHAWLEDTFEMVGYYLDFHDTNVGTHLPHVKAPEPWYSRSRTQTGGYHGHGFDSEPAVEGTVCEEAEHDVAGCYGKVLNTEYGPLCTAHWAWYVD